MSAETITREDILEQIDDMQNCLYRIDEDARWWREQIDDENLRSALYDVEQGTQRLMTLVEKLTPPAPPAPPVPTADTDDLRNYLDGEYGGRH